MTAAFIAISIVLIIIGGMTASILSYFRLQRHRADAVAMAAYRRLADEAVANQQELRQQLAVLESRIDEIAQVLRSVDGQ